MLIDMCLLGGISLNDMPCLLFELNYCFCYLILRFVELNSGCFMFWWPKKQSFMLDYNEAFLQTLLLPLSFLIPFKNYPE
jgi:hypothetical protein